MIFLLSFLFKSQKVGDSSNDICNSLKNSNWHIFDIAFFFFFSNIKVGDKCSFSPPIEILPATEILANLVVSLCKNQQNMFEAKCIIAMHLAMINSVL